MYMHVQKAVRCAKAGKTAGTLHQSQKLAIKFQSTGQIVQLKLPPKTGVQQTANDEQVRSGYQHIIDIWKAFSLIN